MNVRISYRGFGIGLGIAIGLGTVVKLLSGLSFWVCFVIGLIALVVNGFVASIEDRAS